nr:uncharacterized protein CTRU02_15661 [Colletotrichum truncatum]KAF6780787.1 hypothetical protein CTRU02_15661 [Colletotrichum truncatum]
MANASSSNDAANRLAGLLGPVYGSLDGIGDTLRDVNIAMQEFHRSSKFCGRRGAEIAVGVDNGSIASVKDDHVDATATNSGGAVIWGEIHAGNPAFSAPSPNDIIAQEQDIGGADRSKNPAQHSMQGPLRKQGLSVPE